MTRRAPPISKCVYVNTPQRSKLLLNMTFLRIALFSPVFFVCVALHAGKPYAGELSLKQTDQGYEVLIDGKPFAGYRTDCQGTPIVWPIIGPTGKKMTRDYPMIERDDNVELVATGPAPRPNRPARRPRNGGR